LGHATIQTDNNFWEHPHNGLVNVFQPGKVDAHLPGELAPVDRFTPPAGHAATIGKLGPFIRTHVLYRELQPSKMECWANIWYRLISPARSPPGLAGVSHAISSPETTATPDLVDQTFDSSEKRLTRALLLLARFGIEDKPEEVVADISQETLAEMIGTTSSQVNFFMNKFRRLGFIDYNDRLRVHNSLLNVVLHE
jgi:hypothetical protein